MKPMDLHKRLIEEAYRLGQGPRREEETAAPRAKRREESIAHGGGYVTTEELEAEREKQQRDIKQLEKLLLGRRSLGAAMAFASLRNRYPQEYRRLCRKHRKWL